jgi:hypothetical protein
MKRRYNCMERKDVDSKICEIYYIVIEDKIEKL